MSQPSHAGGEGGTAELAADYRRCFDGLARIGRNQATGGYNRFAWSAEDAAARRWFETEAEATSLRLERDGNGNLWAWWGAAGAGAVVTGSHLDTVPEGGAFDGALGIVSAFVAVRDLQRRGTEPNRPVAIVAFADEEGARFGVATFGSRLLVGALDPGEMLLRTDRDGVSVAEAMGQAGVDPHGIGADPARLTGIGCFLELHIEQGRALVDVPAPLGVATAIWPHGRWRLSLSGEANHAGTTRLIDRSDPTLVLSRAIEAARGRAAAAGSLATVGRIIVEPNGTNAVASGVTAWLDARAADEETLTAVVESWTADVGAAAAEHGVELDLQCESRAPAVEFDAELSRRLGGVLRRHGLPDPSLPTGAGHDAGALSAVVPTAMLFVRNPTGVSHSPMEQAEARDCVIGTEILAAALEELACR